MLFFKVREGANKQVISSPADSLIKISRIWADFFSRKYIESAGDAANLLI